MNRPTLVRIIGLLCLAVPEILAAASHNSRSSSSRSSSPAAESAPASTDFKDRYGVLEEHNMFMRDRGHKAPPSAPTTREAPPPRPPPPPPEASLVLTGVVRDADERVAFVEDTAAGKVLRLGVGDAVARGKVVEIQDDAFLYESAGNQAWIEIGRTLMGEAFVPSESPAPVTTSRASAPEAPAAAEAPASPEGGPTTLPAGARPGAPTAAATPAAPTQPDPNLSAEQRLRLRRMQELQRRR